MKKFCLILAACLVLAGNARAAGFMDTLGAECGRLLYSLNEYEFPATHSAITERNTRFDALEKCIELYKQNGGNMEELNARYMIAVSLGNCTLWDCLAGEATDDNKVDKCYEMQRITLNVALKSSRCGAYSQYKDIYPKCDIIETLKDVCENKTVDK